MDLDRRAFLRLLGLGALTTAAGLVVPELIQEPRRRLWQVGAQLQRYTSRDWVNAPDAANIRTHVFGGEVIYRHALVAIGPNGRFELPPVERNYLGITIAEADEPGYASVMLTQQVDPDRNGMHQINWELEPDAVHPSGVATFKLGGGRTITLG